MRDLYQISVDVAYGRGSVLLRLVAIRYVLAVLWMTSYFFYIRPYNGMNFATKDRFRLN